jgi:hypothetical protein
MGAIAVSKEDAKLAKPRVIEFEGFCAIFLWHYTIHRFTPQPYRTFLCCLVGACCFAICPSLCQIQTVGCAVSSQLPKKVALLPQAVQNNPMTQTTRLSRDEARDIHHTVFNQNASPITQANRGTVPRVKVSI